MENLSLVLAKCSRVVGPRSFFDQSLAAARTAQADSVGSSMVALAEASTSTTVPRQLANASPALSYELRARSVATL